MAKIKFLQKNDNQTTTTKVYLDDKDITDSIKSFRLKASFNEITVVHLELCPSEVEIESDGVLISTSNFDIDDLLDAITEDISNKLVIKKGCAINEEEEEEEKAGADNT